MILSQLLEGEISFWVGKAFKSTIVLKTSDKEGEAWIGIG
jgi:hypothetical protein